MLVIFPPVPCGFLQGSIPASSFSVLSSFISLLFGCRIYLCFLVCVKPKDRALTLMTAFQTGRSWSIFLALLPPSLPSTSFLLDHLFSSLVFQPFPRLSGLQMRTNIQFLSFWVWKTLLKIEFSFKFHNLFFFIAK